MAKMTLARGRMMTKRRREIEKDRRKERERENKTIKTRLKTLSHLCGMDGLAL